MKRAKIESGATLISAAHAVVTLMSISGLRAPLVVRNNWHEVISPFFFPKKIYIYMGVKTSYAQLKLKLKYKSNNYPFYMYILHIFMCFRFAL